MSEEILDLRCISHDVYAQIELHLYRGLRSAQRELGIRLPKKEASLVDSADKGSILFVQPIHTVLSGALTGKPMFTSKRTE